MPISVGGIFFDGIEGTAWERLTGSQLDSYANAMQSMGISKPPPTSQGQVRVWADVTEYDGGVLKSSGTRLIGSGITVDFGYGTVTGVVVAGFEPNWTAKKGTINGGIFEAIFTFDSSADKNGDGDQTTAKVQTGTVFGTWTDQPDLKCFTTSDGVGTYAGEAAAETVGLAPLDLVAQWVRVLDADDNERFIGKVVARSIAGGARTNAKVEYHFTGLAGALDQISIPYWWEWGGDNLTWLAGVNQVVNPGDVLPFNGLVTGDRSDVVKTLPNATTAFMPARGVPGTQFNALNALDTLLKFARQAWPYGPTWSIGGQSAALANIKVTVNPRGMSLLEAIAAVISLDKDMTFRLEHSGTNVELVIRSVDTDNEGAAPIDLTPTEFLDFETGIDEANRLDRFHLTGPRDQWVSTFSFKDLAGDAIKRGWDNTAHTTWGTATGDERDAPAVAMVYRRFILDPSWQGGTDRTPGRVLPYLRQLDALGQENGFLTAGGTWPNARVAVQFQRVLPIGKGRNWGTVYTKINPHDESEGPLVFAVKSSTWIPIHNDMQVQIGDDQASIILGRDRTDAETIKAYLDDGYRIVFTLGWIHPMPWRVSWIRESPPATAYSPIDLPRSAMFERQDEALQRIFMDTDVVVGLDAAGAPIYGDVNAGRIDGGDSLALERIRGRLAKIHGEAAGTVSFTRAGLDVTDPLPGDLVTDATVPISAVLNATETVNAIVARRSFNFTRGQTAVAWTGSRLIGGTGQLVRAVPKVDLSRPATWGLYTGGIKP